MTALLHATTLLVLALSALLVLVRLWRGPSVFDRAVALETLTLVMVAALLSHDNLAVDAALGLALFAFIGTVMLGRFLGQGEFPHE